jgi:polysaccharide export outer membrane protein
MFLKTVNTHQPEDKMKTKMCKTLIVLAIAAMVVGTGPKAFCQAKPAYRIGAGDVLEIVTWKEPDFSRPEVLVRTDGMITFPLLNDIQAAGLTPTDLKKAIEGKLKDYVANPVVTVTVRDPASQVFYILGEVQNTGQYPLRTDLTVLQAFAMAGGFTEWASKKEIMLFRGKGGQEKIFRINYKEIARGKNLKQNIQLKANDTIVVP